MKTTIEKSIKIPTVPNFLICEDDTKIAIGQLPEKELRKIAKAWTEALVSRAKEQIDSVINVALTTPS